MSDENDKKLIDVPSLRDMLVFKPKVMWIPGVGRLEMPADEDKVPEPPASGVRLK